MSRKNTWSLATYVGGQGFGALMSIRKKCFLILHLEMEGQLSKMNRTTILNINNGELQKQETQEEELHDSESEMKRIESEEECNTSRKQ